MQDDPLSLIFWTLGLACIAGALAMLLGAWGLLGFGIAVIVMELAIELRASKEALPRFVHTTKEDQQHVG